VGRVFTAAPVFAIAGRRVNAEYARRLRSAADAVALVPEGAYVLQNNAVGEPPGLLAAIAERVRAGDLRRVRMASLLPMGGSAASIAPACATGRLASSRRSSTRSRASSPTISTST
jgi:acyl-CoA hydrolase